MTMGNKTQVLLLIYLLSDGHFFLWEILTGLSLKAATPVILDHITRTEQVSSGHVNPHG